MLNTTVTHRFAKIFVALILVLSTSSCVLYWTKTGDAQDPTNANSILIYGFIDDSKAPFKFRWGNIRQMLPKTEEPFWDLKLNKEGLFFLENLPVGSYTTYYMGGPERGLSSSTWRWGFPSPSSNPEFKLTELRATKPGIYFMGAYKIYESKQGGFFSKPEYSALPTDRPTEIEILEQLREKTRNSKWDKLVVERIRQLKNGK